jgi:hypothetical protein
MTSTELRELFQSAVEAAKAVPDNLQPLAFAKAIELLRNSEAKSDRQTPRRGSSPGGAPTGKSRLANARPGPKAALGVLLDERYFETDRSQSEIQRFLRESKGHEYSQNELSISLLRVVRKGILRREKDIEGHFLYHAANI